jgi:hypothetical protein
LSPKSKKTSDIWPPKLPENIDEPSSEQEARLWTVGLSKYTITPNKMFAGKEESIPPSLSSEDTLLGINSESGVVFYVDPKEFIEFTRELESISEKTLAVYDYVKISDIKDLTFAEFIVSKVINSSLFSEKDLNILEK